MLYLNRESWGARTDLVRLGYNVPRDQRTEIIVHHTVIVDSDATPNLWETIDEVKAKMRQLQTIRPDLGLDVPYSFVIFLMADGTIIVCEGRGLDRTGAHTYGHNTSGIGVAFEGNFELSVNIERFTVEINQFLGWLKFDKDMSYLQDIFKHNDFSNTACPGLYIVSVLSNFMFVQLEEEEDEMTNEQMQQVLEKIQEGINFTQKAAEVTRQVTNEQAQDTRRFVQKVANVTRQITVEQATRIIKEMEKIIQVKSGNGIKRGDTVVLN